MRGRRHPLRLDLSRVLRLVSGVRFTVYGGWMIRLRLEFSGMVTSACSFSGTQSRRCHAERLSRKKSKDTRTIWLPDRA